MHATVYPSRHEKVISGAFAFAMHLLFLALLVFGGVLALTQMHLGSAWMGAGLLAGGAMLWLIGGGEMARACRALLPRAHAAP